MIINTSNREKLIRMIKPQDEVNEREIIMNPLILNIESSTQQGSINIAFGGTTIATKQGVEIGNFSERITVLIEELLTETGNKVSDLNAVAISLGPGSYTSLRIGLSIAKGICYGKKIPLIGIPTLEMLAYYTIEQFKHKKGFYISLIDAKRMDAYAAIYNEKMETILPSSFVTLTEEWIKQWAPNQLLIAGDGQNKIKMFNVSEFPLLLGPEDQRAEMMSKQSYNYYLRGTFIDVAYSVPNYLLPPNITKAKNIL